MTPILLSLLAGALLYGSFPPHDHGALAFVALVPLFRAIRGRGKAARFALGLIAGNAAYTAAVAASILRAANEYFDHPLWVDAGFALVAPQIYGAAYLGLFAVLAAGELKASPTRRVLTIPAIWVAVELLRSRLWHGAPWLLLAHSQHERLWLIQLADFLGTAGIAFVVVLVNVLVDHLVAVVQQREPLRATAVSMVAVVLGAAGVYGGVQLREWNRGGEALRIGMVQPALPGEWRARLIGVPRSLHRLRELSARLAAENLDLLIWPENALGFSLSGNDDLGRRVAGTAQGAATLLGAPRVVEAADGGGRFRNTAFLVDADGAVRTYYDKIRLTPYAEYLPLRAWGFGRRGVAPGDRYEPGDELTLFPAGAHYFATMICFEAVYAELARAFVARGAEFLVNLSNDDWFGDEAAVQQHFVAALFRAVENRRYLVRVTNSGQSGVIDPRGVVVRKFDLNLPVAAVTSVVPIREVSFYTRWGDVFAWSCVAIALLAKASRMNWFARDLTAY